MGILVDERRAEETPCKCFQIGPTKEAHDIICFSPGIIGTLTNAQDNLYCTKKDIGPPSPKLKERINKFVQAIHAAQTRYKGEGIETWLTLTGEELRKRGLEV